MLKLVSTGISTKGVAKHPLYITSNIAKQGQFFTRVFCDRNVSLFKQKFNYFNEFVCLQSQTRFLIDPHGRIR